MRMYGRLNKVVVKDTNAVNATRNTLKGSTKNWSSKRVVGPLAMTRMTSSVAARNVPKLNALLSSAAQRRSPVSASSAAPTSGMPRTQRSSISRP
jgi:hypothetical protein